MLTIFPTTNYNTNFKAASAKPNIKELEKQITAIVKDEVIIPKNAVKNSIPNIDKRVALLTKISALPLIGVVGNYYIEKINKQIEQAAKTAQFEKMKQANALKVDSEGKTMAYKLLQNGSNTSFIEIVEKYPDVLLVRTNEDKSCLSCALWHGSALVNYIVRKLVSNPNYDPNKQYEYSQLIVIKGDTDAHILARFGKLDDIKTIASHPNIDLSICNDHGETPMDVALNDDKIDILNFLKTKM